MRKACNILAFIAYAIFIVVIVLPTAVVYMRLLCGAFEDWLP